MNYMHHMKLAVFLIIFPFKVLALNFSSTALKLNCPERGIVEVILHVYDHTQEAWKDNFETGAGHKRSGDIEIIPFANGDTLLHRISTDSFGYVYNGEMGFRHCDKLDERGVYPNFG